MDLRALIFMPALVGAAISAFVFALFAATYYLTVLESTAAGAKEVLWIPGPITENLGKPFYLAWLLVLWLGPAYIIGRGLAASTGAAWVALAVPVLVAWLLYPVSQLSSLCASSIWIPLHPQVFTRLAQRPGTVAGFLLLTLPVFALGGLAFKWAFLTEKAWHLLFAGAPLMVFAGFLYARLLGRLAFALMFTKDVFKRKKKKKSKPDKPTTDEMEAIPVTEPDEPEPTFAQPSELPPLNTPDGELAGYNVLIADDPPAKKRVKAEVVEDAEPEPEPKPKSKPEKRPVPKHGDPSRTWTDEDDDATPYSVNPSEVQPEDRVPEEVLKPRADEMALLDRKDAVKPPKRVWNAELFAFLGQPGTISAIVLLCLIATVAGAMVRVARMFNPVAGGD